MFEKKNIIYIIFAVALIFLANYVGKHFKQYFLEEKNDEADLIQKYLLNDSQIYGMNKPKIWVHSKYEMNARRWKDFASRNTNDFNQPYINYTIQSIIDHNQKDFYICLIDDSSFSNLIPEWDAYIPNMAEPNKTYFRELGLMTLLKLYGGMVIPDSFLCTKPLWNFYKDGISANRPFVCEKINQTCNLMKQTKKMLFIPDPYFAGCSKKDETMSDLVEYMKKQLLKNLSLFIFLSSLSSMVKADTYNMAIEGLVFLGVTDAQTVNHNIGVYQSILKKTRLQINCNPKQCGTRNDEMKSYYVLKNLHDLQQRVKGQFTLLDSDTLALFQSDYSVTIAEATEAAKKNDFNKILKLIDKAKIELESAKI